METITPEEKRRNSAAISLSYLPWLIFMFLFFYIFKNKITHPNYLFIYSIILLGVLQLVDFYWKPKITKEDAQRAVDLWKKNLSKLYLRGTEEWKKNQEVVQKEILNTFKGESGGFASVARFYLPRIMLQATIIAATTFSIPLAKGFPIATATFLLMMASMFVPFAQLAGWFYYEIFVTRAEELDFMTALRVHPFLSLLKVGTTIAMYGLYIYLIFVERLLI